MVKKKKKSKVFRQGLWVLLLLLGVAVLITYGRYQEKHRIIVEDEGTPVPVYFSLEEVPSYHGIPYYEVNQNVPYFQESEKITEAFEYYGALDKLGRCSVAYANICRELMPIREREDISVVKPTGWQSVRYEFVDEESLYNRCHLIGFQLAGENANHRNLITGTRYMNVEGMLPFENMVDDYVDTTGNHVLYRVTPIFEGSNLVATGVLMEAWSVEDEGKGICFNVFCYNVQPGVLIDYADGANEADPEYREYKN